MKKLFTFFSFVVLMLTSAMPAQAAKKCADFRTQAQAQAHYKSLKRANKTGWKSLDRNKDGVACECLKKNTCKKGKSTSKSKSFGSKKTSYASNKKSSSKKASTSKKSWADKKRKASKASTKADKKALKAQKQAKRKNLRNKMKARKASTKADINQTPTK